MLCQTSSQWDEFLEHYPQAHLLQLSGWGNLKSDFGWKVQRVVGEQAGAQILFRKLPLGLSVAYIPKGPVGKNWQTLWPEIDRLCKRQRSIFLKVEPDAWEGEVDGFLPSPAWRPSAPIQPRRTIVIPLSGDEDAWLERMKQKTRYNIRLAQKKDVQMTVTTDVEKFYQLMLATGQRDQFGVHSREYYQKAYAQFAPGGQCEILMAEFEGQPLAALMLFFNGQRAWYFYGASNDLERNRMPAYLLQWEAMRRASRYGCTTYDLWGVPDEPLDVLEAEFSERSEGLWGVYRFKRGFGGALTRSAGAWDRVYSRPLYWAYKIYARRLGREA